MRPSPRAVSLGTLVAIVGALISLTACTSIEQRRDDYTRAMNAWIGHSADDLVIAMGPPSKDFTLSTGGRVFEYYHHRRITSGGGSVTYLQQVFVPASGGRPGYWVAIPTSQAQPIFSSDVSCKLLFHVSPKNVVERWSAEGSDCY